jgi:hypothetical protein
LKRLLLAGLAAAALLAAGVAAAPSSGAQPPVLRQAVPLHSLCSSGYTDAVIGGEHKCLHAGEFCSAAHEAEYERYGFSCVDGHLKTGASAPVPAPAPAPATTTAAAPTVSTPSTSSTPAATTTSTSSPGGVNVGTTVLLKQRTKMAGCKLGALPDRRCSPGAYMSGLTKAVICSSTFRTGPIRNVPESEKHMVEVEYGLAPKGYGATLEVDHIVSLELGGSNDIANLYPEKAVLPGHQPGFHVKDKLENAAHKAVCAGTITLSVAQHQIAANWELLYKRLFGVAPTG